MVDGNKLGDVGFQKLGTPYSEMDCQAFVEWCLRQCGMNKDLAGSNAWYREVMKNGAIMSPEECVRQLGCVPKGAFLFILEHDGNEPEKYKPDGLGNASHIGICTIPRGEGAIHSSASRGCVAESKFKGKTINGGWNRVGLWDQVAYDYGGGGTPMPAHRTIRQGDRGDDVKEMQEILIRNGYNVGSSRADGIFGKNTKAAVVGFQKANGLTADGICGPRTWEKLLAEKPGPAEERYTVTIPNLTKEEAEGLCRQWTGAEKRKE